MKSKKHSIKYINNDLIQRLKQHARRSDVRTQHASAIVEHKTGRVMAIASNYHLHNCHSEHIIKKGDTYTIHAEKAVYNKFVRKYPHLAKRREREYDIVVVRIKRDADHFQISKPCVHCTKWINKLMEKNKINNVYYTVNS